MKKFAVGLVAMLLMFTCSACGDPNGFFESKMKEFPIEYEGYSLVKVRDGEIKENDIRPTTFIKDETEFTVEFQSVGDLGKTELVIRTSVKSMVLDRNFMETHSETFQKISQVWRGFKGNKVLQPNDVFSVFLFDNEIFIATRTKKYNKITTGSYPLMIYHFDFDTETVLYAGYYLFRTENVGIIKNTSD